MATGLSVLPFFALPRVTKSQTITTREEVSRIVDAWVDAYQSLTQPQKMMALLAEDIFFEDPTFRLKHTSRTSLQKMIEETAIHFSSVQIDPGLVLIDPPWGTLQPTISGTIRQKSGESRNIHVRGATFLKVENGKIQRWTDYYDYRTYTEQLSGQSAGTLTED